MRLVLSNKRLFKYVRCDNTTIRILMGRAVLITSSNSNLRLKLFFLPFGFLFGGGEGFNFLGHVHIFSFQVVLRLFERGSMELEQFGKMRQLRETYQPQYLRSLYHKGINETCSFLIQ